MAKIILRTEGIYKDFGSGPVLKNINLPVYQGEILGIIGENGAGKSTLMKILSGIYQQTSGRIYIDDVPVTIRTPIDARRLKIALVPQEFNLVNDLPVYNNIFLGAELLTKSRLLNKEAMKSRTAELLSQLDVIIDPEARIDGLSAAQKQMVEICKALAFESRILIMDEPTTMLTKHEIGILFKLIRQLRSEGMTILYISHKLKEVKTLCDRVVILRDGELVHEGPTADISTVEMAQKMVGRELESIFPAKNVPSDEVIFEAKEITVPGILSDISFQLRRGEILGFAGLVGAGRTELAEIILGIRRKSKGDFFKNGKQMELNDPSDAVAAGISYLSEDRQGTGIITSFTVTHNITLASLKTYCRSAVDIIDRKKERQKVQGYVDYFHIKTDSLDIRLEKLSGGNQQKVSLAKSLDTAPSILIVDEPTRGVDVSAKHEIYRFINDLVKTGISCIFISSELEEIIGMCNRVVVMREGRVATILEDTALTEEEIMFYATGIHEEAAS
ncbi:MAG: sugar ABC transporter ATP-binding protein [Spirochaetales bacterium]|nr:sugar ABC transporter ATP-binding protein [Spirochaetales bacterium]